MDSDAPLPVSSSQASIRCNDEAEPTESKSMLSLVRRLNRSSLGSSSTVISDATVFNLHTIPKSRFRGRTFTFRCNNSAECLEWIEILRRAVAAARRSSALVSFHQKFQVRRRRTAGAACGPSPAPS